MGDGFDVDISVPLVRCSVDSDGGVVRRVE
jgi:hypothetical protein